MPRGRPGPPAGRRAAPLGLAGRAGGPDLAGARLRHPWPGPHAVRRVAGDPRPTSSSGPRRPRCTRPTSPATSRRCPRRTPTACRRCRPSTPASCSRTCSTTATSSARPASPPRRPALASVVPLEVVLASIDARLGRENGRIDVLMLSGGEPTLYPQLARAARRGRRPADRAGPGQHQRARHRAGRRAARPPRRAPRAGRGLPAVRRRVRRGLHPPPRRGHPAVQGARRRTALRRGRVHHADDDCRARCERRRDRRGDQACAGHAVRRRRDHPAGLRQRPQRRASIRWTGSPTPACSRAWRSRPRDW